MKKLKYFFPLLLILVFAQNGKSACTYTVSTSVSPATFLACGTVTITAGVSVTVTGTLSLTGSQTLKIVNNGTLTIDGGLSASGNTQLNLSGSGPIIINGNLSVSGSLNLTMSDALTVNGNATFSGSSQVQGSGSITVTGTSTASGSTDVFGWTSGSCTGCTLSNGNSLPIELLKFEAVYANGQVDINWVTVTETNNKHFIIERSSNGVDFTPTQTIASNAPNGTSLQTLSYYTKDLQPLFGLSYYRLKQVDINGAYKIFPIVRVHVGNTSVVLVYPNPAAGEVSVETSDDYNDATIDIINVIGKKISSLVLDGNKGKLNINDLDNGVYFLTVSNGVTTKQIKLIVQK